MGGVRTNYTGESPTLKGLFAAGEAACWDMHGFNRLGGNSVAETVVAGMIVGEFIADFCDRENLDIPLGLVREAVEREQGRLDALLSGSGKESAPKLKEEMQSLMTDKVGIFRTGEKLQSAVDTLQQLLVRSRNIVVPYKAVGANPELVMAYRTQKMIKLALTIAYGALVRTESRGAHFRNDFPRRNDAEWLKRTLAWWKNESDTLPTLTYEPLDVRKMELPPGWRGYGAKDYVDHPDTPARQAEVEALKAKLGADRFALQQALLPFDHLLPSRLRGRNERIDEPMASRAAE
jgi:fumarate reductase flavoprotein subunit